MTCNSRGKPKTLHFPLFCAKGEVSEDKMNQATTTSPYNDLTHEKICFMLLFILPRRTLRPV